MIKALIFDCFGVFYTDPVFAYMRDPSTPNDKAISLHGLDEQAALGNISKAEFIREAKVTVGISSEEVDRRFFHGHDRNYKLIDLVQDLRKKYKVSLLSNIGGDMMDGFFTKAELEHLFDDVILSGIVGLTKPDPRIFKLACENLDVKLNEAIMIDDLQENVDIAISLGMQGIAYLNFEQFVTDLNKLF